MELMSIRLIKYEGFKRLKNNFPRAISLVFVMLFLIVFLHISRMLTDIFIHSFGVTTMVTDELSLSMLIALIFSIILSFTLIMPLWLNIKKWYMNLTSDGPPCGTTLSLLNSPRIYFKSVFYAIVKSLAIAVMFFALLIPMIALTSVLRSTAFLDGAQPVELVFIIIFIMAIVFGIIAIIYAIYIALGLFFSDYIYLSNIESNPIKAILLSMKIAKKHRVKLLILYLSLLPYMLASLLILPIVFTLPYIQSTLACFAKQQLGLHLYEKSQNGEHQ